MSAAFKNCPFILLSSVLTSFTTSDTSGKRISLVNVDSKIGWFANVLNPLLISSVDQPSFVSSSPHKIFISSGRLLKFVYRDLFFVISSDTSPIYLVKLVNTDCDNALALIFPLVLNVLEVSKLSSTIFLNEPISSITALTIIFPLRNGSLVLVASNLSSNCVSLWFLSKPSRLDFGSILFKNFV